MNFSKSVKNLFFLIIFIFSGVTLLVIIDGLLTGAELIPFNTAIEQTITLIRTPFLTNAMILVTEIGTPFFLAACSFFLTAILLLKKDKEGALILLISIILAILSFSILKITFQVPRPATEILRQSGWSFPSGHATVATAFFFAMSYSFFGYVKGFFWKSVLVTGSIIGTVLIAFSRIYLGAHWGLDILAGVALGLISVSAVVLVVNFFSKEQPWGRKRKRTTFI